MNSKQFVAQLQKLVSFPSLSTDLETNLQLFDYLDTLVHHRAQVKRIINDRAGIWMASYQTSDKPDIAYLVHSDVVSGQKSQFKMQQKGDKLIGRGVSDMKFSIPIGIAILNHLIEQRSELSFCMVVTSDEELGGTNGAKFLAENHQFRPTALIVPDGGNNFDFIEKAKGVCQLTITVPGKPAHASTPWKGDNALDKLVLLASQLLEIYQPNNKKEDWLTTMNIGEIKGGISVNQVCPTAEMKLDFRFPETTTAEAIKKQVKALAQKIDPQIQITSGEADPTKTNTDLAIVKKFIKAFADELGREIRIRPSYGASDARYFASPRTPILMIKPNGGDIHGDEEWVSLKACISFYNGLKRFLQLK